MCGPRTPYIGTPMYYFSLTDNHDAGNRVRKYTLCADYAPAIPSPPNPTRTGHGHYLIRRWRQAVGVRHVIGRVLIFYACRLRPRPCVRSSAPCVRYYPRGRDPYLSEIGGSCCVPGCCHCHCPVLAYPASPFLPTLSERCSTVYYRANPSELSDRWLGGGAYV